MASIVMIVVGLLLIVLYIALIWYFVRSIIIIGRQSTGIAILAFLFSPFAQIFYYLTNKDKLSLEDRRDFKRLFWLYIIVFIIIIAGIYIVLSDPSMVYSTYSESEVSVS